MKKNEKDYSQLLHQAMKYRHILYVYLFLLSRIYIQSLQQGQLHRNQTYFQFIYFTFMLQHQNSLQMAA